MTARIVRWHSPEGCRTAITLEPGRKWLPVILVDHPMGVRKVLLTETKHMTDLPGYTVAKAAREYLKIGKVTGISAKAKRLLRELRLATSAAA